MSDRIKSLFPFKFGKVTHIRMDKIMLTVDTYDDGKYRLIYTEGFLKAFEAAGRLQNEGEK